MASMGSLTRAVNASSATCTQAPSMENSSRRTGVHAGGGGEAAQCCTLVGLVGVQELVGERGLGELAAPCA